VRPAAAELDRVDREVARRAVELTYEAVPEYARTLNAIGRRRCEEDAHFHVRFLVGSLAVDDPAVFVDYARWAAELLARYRVDPENLAAMFRATATAVAELAPGAADRAAAHLEAGASALDA
jgi:hypothetical protein